VVAARLTLERPGNVLPISKTSAVFIASGSDCPVRTIAPTVVYPHTDDTPYTIHYTTVPELLQLNSGDGPSRLEACRRYFVKLNCSRCAVGWFYILMTGNNVLMNIMWVVYETGRQSGTC
jgi:hypothetical protein